MINYYKFIKKNIFLTILINIFFCKIIFAQNISFSDNLVLYGYSPPQQKALEQLMIMAHILPPESTLDDHYPKRQNNIESIDDLLDFIIQIQKGLKKREANSERFDMKQEEWMTENADKIFSLAEELNLVNEIDPKVKNTDAICVLGATYPSMKVRLNYLHSLIINGKITTKNLILLAGERYASVKADGDEKLLSEIAKEQKTDLKQLTETNLITYIYSKTKIYGKLPVYIIDTKANGLPRPTTETTMQELIIWLKDHPDIKHITFISSQPNVKYQEAVIKQTLLNNPEISFEVIGPVLQLKENIPVRLLDGLSSFLWAKTPEVILNLTKNVTNQDVIDKLVKLYANNFLIFRNIQSLFKKS